MLSENMGSQFPNVPSANGVATPSCGHGECSSNYLNHPVQTRMANVAQQSGFNQNDTGGYTPRHASGNLTPLTLQTHIPQHDTSEDEGYYQDEKGNDLRF